MVKSLPAHIEEEEIALELQKLTRYPKLSYWLQLFLDKDNKLGQKTWGNRTQAALIAYNLDGSDPKQYATACSIGSQNFRKLKVAATMYYELDGMNAAKVLDLIAAHAVNKGGKALEMLAVITNVYDAKTPPQTLIQNNIQINSDGDITQAEEESLDKQFHDFIVSKAKAQSATLHPDTSNSSGV